MTATPPPALELREVGKTFGAAVALRDVSLEVRSGSIHGLCGENGAGKSTLVKILNGQYPAGTYSGTVLVDGTVAALGSSADAIAHGIGVVPQETSVIETLTVAENIGLTRMRRWRLRSRRTIERTVQAFLDELEIELDASQPVEELSTSSKQLLMIARALNTQPAVLLLDEPTTALTDAETANLHRLLRGLAARGTTIVLISHRLDEIVDLCDEVSVLRDGALVDVISAKDLTVSRLVSSMTGRDLGELYPSDRASAGDELVLAVESVSVAHPRIAGRTIVDDVSFELHAGEVLGISGQLGSGRSELLLAIAGGLARRGSVSVAGRPLVGGRPAAAVRAGITLVSEDRKATGMLFNLPVSDNTTLSALGVFSRLGVMARNRQRRTAADFIARLSIAGADVDSAPGNLSGGNQQKVLLARAVVPRPRVILLDEPTKGVDIGAKADLYRSIADLAAEGTAFVMVSSELPELLGNCDRILMMHRGRVVATYRSAETSREQLLEASMTGSISALTSNPDVTT